MNKNNLSAKSETKVTSKTVATLGKSRNFLVSILTVIFLVFGYWGADVSPGAAETIIDTIFSGNLTAILMAVIVNLVNPITKIIANAKAKGGLDFGFVRSLNFWTQFGTVVFMMLGTIGLVFPENAVSDLIGAIENGDVGLILLALVGNVINPILHFFKKKKPLPTQSPRPV